MLAAVALSDRADHRAGTFSGGWRVIKTLGTRVTDIVPAQGFSVSLNERAATQLGVSQEEADTAIGIFDEALSAVERATH